jgi:hypothetical protein
MIVIFRCCLKHSGISILWKSKFKNVDLDFNDNSVEFGLSVEQVDYDGWFGVEQFFKKVNNKFGWF